MDPVIIFIPNVNNVVYIIGYDILNECYDVWPMKYGPSTAEDFGNNQLLRMTSYLKFANLIAFRCCTIIN